MSSEDSRPLAGLPAADRTLLVTPPLELAIAEVRFATATPGGAMAPDVGLGVLNRLSELGVEFARIEPLQQNRLTLNLQAGIAQRHRSRPVPTDGPSPVPMDRSRPPSCPNR